MGKRVAATTVIRGIPELPGSAGRTRIQLHCKCGGGCPGARRAAQGAKGRLEAISQICAATAQIENCAGVSVSAGQNIPGRILKRTTPHIARVRAALAGVKVRGVGNLQVGTFEAREITIG